MLCYGTKCNKMCFQIRAENFINAINAPFPNKFIEI